MIKVKYVSLLLAGLLFVSFSSQVSAAVAKPQIKLIGSYTTSLKGSSANRISNVALAAKKINGKYGRYLKSNEVFNFHKVVGNSNFKQDGWKLATVIENKKKVTGYGGGICQVSSTLFNAVDIARLQLIERHNHSLSVGYVPKGRDATVAWGSKNFIFKNNTIDRLLIRSEVVKGFLYVKIYSA